MTAQQPPHAPVRLLIAENSENAAHEFDSLLRDAGISTRAKIIELATATDELDEADMLLVNTALPELESTLPRLRAKAPHVPIILINAEGSNLTVTRGMQLGAVDVVSKSDPERLVLVVKRELEHVCQSNRLIQTRRALSEAEQRCQLLLQSSKAAIAYVHEGMHIYANDGYLNLFGFEDADELLGLPLMDLMDANSASALKLVLKVFRQDEEECVLNFSGQSIKGDSVSGNMTLAAAEYEGEHCIQVTMRTGIESADVLLPTPNIETETSNGSASPESTDGSSAIGLPEFLAAAAATLGETDDRPFKCIIAAEIDGFGQLQQDHGLAGSLEICAKVEARLRECLGEQSMARLSGHQFSFAISGLTHASVLAEINGYRAKVEALMLEINEKTVRPTLSFGGAELAVGDDLPLPQAVKDALDSAFARTRAVADTLHGNQVDLPGADIGADGTSEVEVDGVSILELINEAIENQRFVLLFQPIISLRGDSDEYYEVFVRMLDRDGKQLLPGVFLRTAIDNDVAGKIDRWVILESIKMLSTHRAKGNNTRLTINVTCNSVTDPEFTQWLGVAIKAARLPSDAVIFQVTEEDASTYIRQTREFFEKLKDMYCRASLSRFAMTPDSFELLSHIPAEFVKIDGTMIEDIGDDAMRERVTTTIRKLQAAGKLSIVPMVESANALSALWQAGANYIQGHYLQEPSAEMDYDFSTGD